MNFNNLFHHEKNIIEITPNNELHIFFPDGDKSIYFYLRSKITGSYEFLMEWNENRWKYNIYNKDNANTFFNLMKRYPQIYKNFIKKLIKNKNGQKSTMGNRSSI